MIPGELFLAKEDIVLNEGLDTVKVAVKNVGDRPVQVGSHYHFFEVNQLLRFDREAAFGFRLDIPAGTSVRFEPGEEKEVELVALGGSRRSFGLNGLTNGQINGRNKKLALERAKSLGYMD